MSATLTKSDVQQMSQTIDRAQRIQWHSRLLARARRSGDVAAQLEHGLHVADARIGLAKSPADAEHWRSVHRQVSDLIEQSGFEWRAGRLVDPAAQASKAKSFAKAAVSKAAAFQGLRGEVMAAIAKARSEQDSDTLVDLYELRDQLTRNAQSVGLRLDHTMRFVPALG